MWASRSLRVLTVRNLALLRSTQPLLAQVIIAPQRALSGTSPLRGLEEFFDNPENFGKSKIRVGREWKEDELRLKSNEDLHKLWFVLLKERNMLLTMKHRYEQLYQNMPNEERLDKVDISMENLESVVRERNRAYFDLECGHSGEPEIFYREGPFGVDSISYESEHVLPPELNEEWLEKQIRHTRHRYSQESPNHIYKYSVYGLQQHVTQLDMTLVDAVRQFERRRREQVYRTTLRKKHENLWKAAEVLRVYPETSKEALEDAYPYVSYEEVTRYVKSRNHMITKFDN